jgi:hypothetical protein
VQSDGTPNAVLLRTADVERIARQLLPEPSLFGPAQAEIGQEEIPQQVIELTRKALAQAPPVAFDVARQVRVFEPYIQYVEISLRGCAIQRRRIELPKSLQGIAPSTELDSRLRTTFDLIEKDSDVSSNLLGKELNVIRDTLTRALGKPWGRVLLRSNRPLFDQRIEGFKERLATHKRAVVESLGKHLHDSQEALVEHFLPLIQRSPPDALLGQIYSRRSETAYFLRSQPTAITYPLWSGSAASSSPQRVEVSAAYGRRFGALQRTGEVEVEVQLLGEADELPRIGERALVTVAEVVEDDAPGLADAGRPFQ